MQRLVCTFITQRISLLMLHYRVVSSRELNHVNIFLPRSRHLGVQSTESMMQTVTPQLSLYFEGLSEEAKARRFL